jgi:MFS family permease
MGIGRFAFTPILPMMQQDAGVSIAAGAWLAAANYVGYLVGALSVIFVPIPAPTAIRAGLVTIGVTTLAMGVHDAFALWIVLRALAGVASAWVLVSTSAWSLERLQPLRRPMLESTVFAGVGVGIALAGVACLALMQLGASASQAWLALGWVAVAIALAVLPLMWTRAATTARTSAPFAWSAEAWRLVLCYGIFGFGYIIPATYVPAMARAIVPDPAIFGWAWPIFGAAAAASTIFAPRALGNRRLWAASALVMAAGVAAPLLVAGGAGIALSALLVGATFMVITMTGMQEARAVAGAAAAPLMAAMTAAFAAGQIAGPLVVSALVRTKGGIALALGIASVLLLLSAIALVREEKPCPT